MNLDFIKNMAFPYQTFVRIVDFMRGKEFYSTVKVDGMSLTIYNYKDHFGVCSRTLEKKNTENNKLWQIAVRYDLERQLKDYNIALQFELAGPGIQGNPGIPGQVCDAHIFARNPACQGQGLLCLGQCEQEIPRLRHRDQRLQPRALPSGRHQGYQGTGGKACPCFKPVYE